MSTGGGVGACGLAEGASSSSSASAGARSIVAPRFTTNIATDTTDSPPNRANTVEGRSDAVATIPISPALAAKKCRGTHEGQRRVRPLNLGRVKDPTPQIVMG